MSVLWTLSASTNGSPPASSESTYWRGAKPSGSAADAWAAPAPSIPSRALNSAVPCANEASRGFTVAASSIALRPHRYIPAWQRSQSTTDADYGFLAGRLGVVLSVGVELDLLSPLEHADVIPTDGVDDADRVRR